jgi:hypothetical protein
MFRRSTLVLPLLLAGCYVYRPMTGTTPPTGDRIRLTLTDAGTANLAAQLGPSTTELSGRVVHDSADAYLISVLGTRGRNGMEADWRGEQVAVPRSLVAHMEQRHFSRTRTVLMGVGTVVAILGAREAFAGPGGIFGGAPPGGGGPPR